MSDHIDLYDSDGLRVGAFCVRTGRAQIGDMFLAAERTCRNIDTYGGFECSGCGADLTLDDDGWALWDGAEENVWPSFCPCCGAKVVER